MHKHKPIQSRTETRPYSGPVATGDDEDPRAHGNVTYVYHCECGATQRANSNAGTQEIGDWVDEAEVS
jgi:hypothetical protein